MLGAGSLSLATARLLGAQFTSDNHRQLLTAASGKGKRGVEELLARYSPKPDVPTSIRKLPPTKGPAGPGDAMLPASSEAPTGSAPVDPLPPNASPSSVPTPATPRRAVVSPLGPDRYEIRFTASAETREKRRRAQDLLRHAIPSGDVAQVIDRALTTLLENLTGRRFAATDRPRASRGTAAGSRDVAATIRRSVWLRDDGRCTLVGENGRTLPGKSPTAPRSGG
jgi:hypothetical protein